MPSIFNVEKLFTKIKHCVDTVFTHLYRVTLLIHCSRCTPLIFIICFNIVIFFFQRKEQKVLFQIICFYVYQFVSDKYCVCFLSSQYHCYNLPSVLRAVCLSFISDKNLHFLPTCLFCLCIGLFRYLVYCVLCPSFLNVLQFYLECLVFSRLLSYDGRAL